MNRQEKIYKDVNDIIEDLIEFEKDFHYLKGCEDIEEFFAYFQSENWYNAYYRKNRNYLKIFDEVVYNMGWNDFFDKRYFEDSYNEKDKEIFLMEFNKKYYRQFSVEYQMIESFDDLFVILNPSKKIKNIFDRLINKKIEETLSLEDKKKFLREIFIRYNLRRTSEIPNSITKCKKIIKRELFVNINDFTQPGNNKKFKYLEDLADYTERNKFYFNLQEAKKNFSYKVLLKLLVLVR